MNAQDKADRIDQLYDAIELVKAGRRREALPILRRLIGEDKDFEDAWLWMSVAVDSPDQSAVCLDNVLRINPANAHASGALYRLRETEMRSEHHRARIRGYRDFALSALWLLSLGVIFAIFFTFFGFSG
jgi:hypothetical protein